MNRIKLFLLGTAVLFGVTAAFAFTTVGPCDDPSNPRYYFDSMGYIQPVGARQYNCVNPPGICTFVIVGGSTHICQENTITFR